MTDDEADFRYTVLAIMLAVPFLNGEHGELATDVRDDLQDTLWRHGYIPAKKMLLEEGATPKQVERAWLAKKAMFERVKPEVPSLGRE